MVALTIEGTNKTPCVVLDPANNKFEISGNSTPEYAENFFKTILNWLDGYIQDSNPKTVFDFKMKYFNTASAERILRILMKLETISTNGKEVVVRWYYEGYDEDMLEGGKSYSDLTKVPFEFIEF